MIVDPVSYLRKQDSILAKVIDRVEKPVWSKRSDHFHSLVGEIINQQLSDKASATITTRFEALFPEKNYTPAMVLALSDDVLRGAGISYSKVSYIKHLATAVEGRHLDFDLIEKLPDEEVITYLTQVKGIGRWTAEMFLMFSLGREDVFSYGDQGLKNAMRQLYALKKHPTPRQAETISRRWRPFRSWACRYLWASLDVLPLDK